MPGPIWPQSYGSWYQSLIRRATAPVREFGKGVAMGAGIPTSTDEIREGMAQALGLAFGVPSAYSNLSEGMQVTGEAISHPVETTKALGELARQHPAGTAGVALGMAVPFGKRPDLKFGAKALKAAERRMEQRVMRERARVHAELEGPTWREEYQAGQRELRNELRKLGITKGDYFTDRELHDLGISKERAAAYIKARNKHSKLLADPSGPIEMRAELARVDPFRAPESPGDDIAMLSTLTTSGLQSVARVMDENDPKWWRAAVEKELARRGLKPDISDELHVLHEGEGAPMDIRAPYGAGSHILPRGNTPPIFTPQEAGEELLYYTKAPDMMATKSVEQIAASQLAKAPEFRRIPLGGIVAAGGNRWMKSTRGWTKLEGKPRGRDFDWIFNEFLGGTLPAEQQQMDFEVLGHLGYAPEEIARNYSSARGSDIRGAIKQLMDQGGLSEPRATALTAKKIAERMKAGRALDEEIVWYNIYQMRGFGKGGMKWGTR